MEIEIKRLQHTMKYVIDAGNAVLFTAIKPLMAFCPVAGNGTGGGWWMGPLIDSYSSGSNCETFGM
jgi:hypothetical protein